MYKVGVSFHRPLGIVSLKNLKKKKKKKKPNFWHAGISVLDEMLISVMILKQYQTLQEITPWSDNTVRLYSLTSVLLSV